jgi:TfoX/Sxy family transcriptional regulator of competence genes
MATNKEYIEYICEQIEGIGVVRYRKMFGEYMVYVDDKPVLLVCDNTVFVKMLDPVKEKMKNAEIGTPYNGAKEHYVLDIDDAAFSKEIITDLLPVTPIPKSRKEKK